MIRTPAELAEAEELTAEEDERYYAPFVPTPNIFDAVYDGIPVAYVGEEGAQVALGHHDPGRVLAVFEAHRGPWLAVEEPLRLADVRSGWAVFRRPGRELAGQDWVWYPQPAIEAAAGAVPVMWLYA